MAGAEPSVARQTRSCQAAVEGAAMRLICNISKSEKQGDSRRQADKGRQPVAHRRSLVVIKKKKKTRYGVGSTGRQQWLSHSLTPALSFSLQSAGAAAGAAGRRIYEEPADLVAQIQIWVQLAPRQGAAGGGVAAVAVKVGLERTPVVGDTTCVRVTVAGDCKWHQLAGLLKDDERSHISGHTEPQHCTCACAWNTPVLHV